MKEYKIKCVFCNKVTTLNLDEEKVNRWRSGELIQDVFPELDADTREVMITRVCKECTKDLFDK